MHTAFCEAYKIHENKQACLSKTFSGEHLGLKCSGYLIKKKYKSIISEYENTALQAKHLLCSKEM